ncbi:hypothetical protein D187_000128 [Cystobacter fuscus DSM 2262]|uniref:Uncharacterized protein n=1 Tax=Cystobacter fuscus (strain ATCC 25194 / DSM 2262 / NBRC 100088 / M29) TaxID=1242864 RepID=S9PNW3_CYSF2|nr:hypothetical protein D187_000128 [Cystobacter fuscus DSM 2262]
MRVERGCLGGRQSPLDEGNNRVLSRVLHRRPRAMPIYPEYLD